MSDPASRDRLDALVFQYLERVEAGESGPAVLDDLCAAHPLEGEALRRGVALLRDARLHPGPAEDGLPERVGPFRLLRRLGAGGMGVVYLAEQASPARLVALKLVRPDQLWFEGYRERFAREIESAARLAHPGIAPVYEMGEHDGVPWFSQEYVVGVPLGALLANVPARSPEALTGADLRAALADALEDEVPDSAWDPDFFRGGWVDVCLRIARQVADALQHAHERGVLHRDVKPSNVLLTPGGRAVLVDFGLATLQGTERLTRSGAQLGSLHYMPPEQVDGRVREVGPRSDVYSLGVTLYELLTLRAPYASQSVQRLRGLILEGHAPAPRTLNRAVPRDVDVVVLTAMDPDRDRRYGTAAAFATDLAAAQAHRPIAARPAGPWLRIARWARRRPAAAVGLVAGFLLFVVAPVVFAVQGYRAARAEADLNVELARALAQSDALLAATLDGFEGVVRRTAHSALDDVPGFQPERLAMIDEGLAAFERVVTARPDDRDVRLQRALMTRTRGDILAHLGRVEEAREEYARAAAVLEDAVAPPECEARWVRELAALRSMQAGNESELGRHAAAAELERSALALQRRAAALDPADARHHREVAVLAAGLARNVYTVEGRTPEIAELLEEALRAADRAVERAPEDPRAHEARARSFAVRARIRNVEGDTRGALEAWSAAASAVARARALDPRDRACRELEAEALAERALIGLARTRDAARWQPDLERARELWDGLGRDYPEVPAYREGLVEVLGALGYARRMAGDQPAGRALLERVLEEHERRAGANPDELEDGLDAAIAAANLANAVLFDESLGEERFRRALELCDRAERLAGPYAQRNRGSWNEQRLRMYLASARGAAHHRLGDVDGVEEQLERMAALGIDLADRHFFTAQLWLHWARLTGDAGGREEALAELELAVAGGFDDLLMWEEAEVEEELAAYARIGELAGIVRARATER